MARAEAARAVRTITHDDPMVADPVTGMIPPYDVSEWARGKSLEEIQAEILRQREVKRATTGLLDHRDFTLELLWAESALRSRRSPAEAAGEPNDAELARIAAAEAAYFAADAAWKEAFTAKRDAISALERARLEHAPHPLGGALKGDAAWLFNPGRKPDAIKAAEEVLRRRADALERANVVRGERLVAMNNVKSNIMARAQARRQGIQGEISREGLLANLRASGVRLTSQIQAEARRAYARGK